MRRFRSLVLAGCVGLVGCGADPAHEASPTALRDVEGRFHDPLQVEDATAHVLIFVTVDCPIANFYSTEIAAMVAEHEDDGVRFFLVHADPTVPPEDVARHQQEYSLPGPALLDPDFAVTRAVGATHTPEVVVLTAGGEIAYQGRIDNWYGDLGRKRAEPGRRHLREALNELLAGQPVSVARTDPIGCDIPMW